MDKLKNRESEKNKVSEFRGLSLLEMEILRFIHEFGFCEIQHIIKRFNIRKSWSYEQMQWLINRGMAMNARVMKYQPRAYYLTLQAIKCLKLDLPPIRNIPLSIYEHQLAVLDVYIKLSMVHHDSVWVTERRLFRDRDMFDLGRDDHLPDGVLIFPDGKQCAIEVEKSLKAKDRLEGIMLGYGLQRAFKEVWYFCTPQVLPTANKIAENMSYIKVYKLSEFV
jgi:hypothetical protein